MRGVWPDAWWWRMGEFAQFNVALNTVYILSKKYPFCFFADFSVTAWNFSTKFHFVNLVNLKMRFLSFYHYSCYKKTDIEFHSIFTSRKNITWPLPANRTDGQTLVPSRLSLNRPYDHPAMGNTLERFVAPATQHSSRNLTFHRVHLRFLTNKFNWL